MDQSHPSSEPAHEGHFIRHGTASGQLLVEPREGVGGHGDPVEERGGEDSHEYIEEWKEIPCDCSFYR